MSFTAAERETVITFSDEGDTAAVWTAQRPIITKLKKNAGATLIEEGKFEGTAWARFEIAAGLISFRSTRVKRELTDEQRAALGKRLQLARA
jgi:hypothetical protein